MKQLEDVYQFIDLVNKTKATFAGLDRTDRRDYPEDAIRESLLNSMVHRDYSFSGSNLVNVYEDRIEFVSLGGLVSGLGVSDKTDKDVSLNEQKSLILQYARENGSVTRKEVEDLISAGTTKAFRLLKELCEDGKLEQKGSGKLSTYVAK